ncbi:hypothetical protein B0T12DRAFT_396953 [Alternaria alternata]|nr:hypothetical protein B0T12DRAFT_396953 [Alternaria alternata]
MPISTAKHTTQATFKASSSASISPHPRSFTGSTKNTVTESTCINCNVQLIAQNSGPKEATNVNMFVGMCRILKPSTKHRMIETGLQRPWFLNITHPAHPGYLTFALLFSKNGLYNATSSNGPSPRYNNCKHIIYAQYRITTPQTPPQLHHNFTTTTSTREEIQ